MELLKIITVETPHMIELIKTVKTFEDAFKVAIRRWGGLEKQLLLEMEIDAGHWSRCMSGKAHFPPGRIKQACQIMENDILLHWLAYQQGYELRIIPKALEERIAEQEAELISKNQKIAMYEEFLAKIGKELKE